MESMLRLCLRSQELVTNDRGYVAWKVKVVEKKTRERFEGNAKRVVDTRHLWSSPAGEPRN